MNRLAPGLIWLILRILSCLPGFALHALARLLEGITFGLAHYRSEVILSNLKNSFPEAPPETIREIARKFRRHFSDLFLEMIMILRLKPGKSENRIGWTDPGVIRSEFEQKRNLIIMTGHFGNWEWTVLPILEAGYRILGVYKPQNSKFADRLMRNIRHKDGITLVSMKETFRILSREIKTDGRPFALILVADQTPARVDIRFRIPFLHQDTAFFTGGEKLAEKFHLPVYYLDQVKHGFARYEAGLTRIYDGTSETAEGQITTEYARLLENSIHKAPHLWLWSHRRWKYRREELPLPA
jgi:KDO2-lipid IV(A) lauroyltransferase